MKILHPESTWISDSVDRTRIDDSVVIYPGCRISGPTTCIGPGTVVGEEGPATVDDCQIAASVRLGGGYFAGSVFHEGVSMGGAANVRPGCIVEEHVECGHAVGLKQTVLFPFAALGSTINFCDCLLSGGTDTGNRSEVGSSFVHFNFTPYQDKATASIFGSVPEGVMLNQPPVFLGGQSGAVGPVRLAHGCTLAAGSILRKDCAGSGTLIIETPSAPDRIPMPGHEERNYRRIASIGLEYIGHIAALREWYLHVRTPASEHTPWTSACCEGAIACLDLILTERIQRLGDALAAAAALKPDLEALRSKLPSLENDGVTLKRDSLDLQAEFIKQAGDIGSADDYVAFIKGLGHDARERGITWLKSIVQTSSSLL